MDKNLTKLYYAMCAVMLLFQLNACKDPVITDKGNTLALSTFNLSHIDTSTVVINTVPDRPLPASGVTTGVLGSLNDLFFGKTYAGIYAQCLLLSLPPSFAGCVVDSAVLIMPYINSQSIYGNCNKPIDIQVYQVSQNMVPGIIYYTNDAFSVNPQPIGQRLNYVPDPVDSLDFIDPVLSGNVDVPYDAQSPMVRVRLSNNFANQLLNANDTDYLASATFIEFFKGIYVTTNPNKVGNGLMYLNLSASAVNLYYHHPSYTPIDTSVFQFQVSTYGVTVNHFDHYYGNTLVQTAMNNQSPNGNTVGYIQAGGGSRIKLTLPYLKNLPANIGITKAELIMPILDTLVSDPSYPPPSSINLTRIDDTLNIDPINDNDYSGVIGTSGVGILTTRLDNNGQSYVCYVFNITLYIQRVLNGYYSNNNGYYVSYSTSSGGNRTIILNQPGKLSTRCQLNITYTSLKPQ